MQYKSKLQGLTFVLLIVLTTSAAFGQSAPEDSNPDDGRSVEEENTESSDTNTNEDDTEQTVESNRIMPETVVTATRFSRPVSEVTRSVKVISREEIETQSAMSRDLGDILGKTVPGMATSTEGLTNFSQKIRGRKFMVMIDGVPISTPLRDGARDLKIIDPESIERVEVVRGGTSVYGFGATGGLINYITRNPDEQRVQGYSKARFQFSTPHPDASLQWSTSHGVSGQLEHFDYLVNVSGSQRNRMFDRYGNRLPPEPLPTQGGLGDTDEWNVAAKLGYDFEDDNQRVDIMFNNYDIEQHTDLISAPGNPPDETARGVRGSRPGDNVETENELFRIGYTNRDFLGSKWDVMAYHQDFTSRFGVFATGTAFEGQSVIKSEKFGGRLTVNTPLAGDDGPQFIWGIDAQNDRTEQPITGPTQSMPELDQNAYAGFAQIDWKFEDIGRLRAGIRPEVFRLDVPSFVQSDPSISNGPVEGGDLSYEEVLFNITGSLALDENVDLFGGFSQGYSLADLGRAIRETPGNTDIEEADLSGRKVNNYELGVRGNWESLNGSIATFFSTSDEGGTFDPSTLQLQRQEQEIWGIESDIDYSFSDQWTVGGTATWMDSRADLDGDGDLDEELPISDVPPFKGTAYLEYTPFDGWNNRLQGLYSGDRDPDATGAFGNADINDFTVFDFQASLDVGPGSLQFGVENLFNEDYFPVASQLYGKNEGAPLPRGYTRGQGRTISIGYRTDW